MVLPLLIAGIVIFAGFLVFLFISPFIKLFFILIFLGIIWKILPKKIKKLKLFEYAVLGIAIFSIVFTFGGAFGFFSMTRLPLAVQQQTALSIPSPLTLFLTFIISVLVIMYIKKK